MSTQAEQHVSHASEIPAFRKEAQQRRARVHPARASSCAACRTAAGERVRMAWASSIVYEKISGSRRVPPPSASHAHPPPAAGVVVFKAVPAPPPPPLRSPLPLWRHISTRSANATQKCSSCRQRQPSFPAQSRSRFHSYVWTVPLEFWSAQRTLRICAKQPRIRSGRGGAGQRRGVVRVSGGAGRALLVQLCQDCIGG